MGADAGELSCYDVVFQGAAATASGWVGLGGGACLRSSALAPRRMSMLRNCRAQTRLLIASVLQAASAILYAKRRGLPARRRFASLDPISNALQITS